LVDARTFDHGDPVTKKYDFDVPEKSSTTRAEMDPIYFELYPIDKTHCRAKLISRADPKLSWIPDMLINYVVKHAMNLALNFL